MMLLQCFVVFAFVFQLSASFEIEASQFQKEVVQDHRIWLVKFYSSLCSGCKEFNPAWEKITAGTKYFRSGEVDVDVPEGTDLAKALGVMDEGLPNVRMFTTLKDTKGETIYSGSGHPRVHEIMAAIRKTLAGKAFIIPTIVALFCDMHIMIRP